ncbi:MAG: bifunctional 4-hydroxy-2-oxoglutarate aldolase/2-dehydro-3-deoxy-phosphogluconate aldolase [Gemmatimonadaceae bacterium]
MLQIHAGVDWTRTQLAMPLSDGSTAPSYDDDALGTGLGLHGSRVGCDVLAEIEGRSTNIDFMTPISSSDSIVAQLRKLRVLPVLVLSDATRAVALGDALFNGGLPIAEITLRTPAALDAIQRLSSERPQVVVGAGTVLTPAQAKEAIENGAQFIVSPGLNPAVVEYCQARSIAIFPGVVTPTEIETAMRFGLHIVKFFPAEPAGGVRYLQAVSAAYGNMEFIPTGGLKRASMATYLATGCVVACGGSWMAPDAWLSAGDFARIERETKDTMMEVSAIQQS